MPVIKFRKPCLPAIRRSDKQRTAGREQSGFNYKYNGEMKER